MLVLSDVRNGEFALEPHEAGWATEAIAFIYIRETRGSSPRFNLRAQISADGYRWIDTGTSLDGITSAGGYFLRLEHFGNWIRLAGDVTGGPDDDSAAFVADIYWALKG
jgi:hypothetical protein